jgi:hypothetical protein
MIQNESSNSMSSAAGKLTSNDRFLDEERSGVHLDDLILSFCENHKPTSDELSQKHVEKNAVKPSIDALLSLRPLGQLTKQPVVVASSSLVKQTPLQSSSMLKPAAGVPTVVVPPVLVKLATPVASNPSSSSTSINRISNAFSFVNPVSKPISSNSKTSACFTQKSTVIYKVGASDVKRPDEPLHQSLNSSKLRFIYLFLLFSYRKTSFIDPIHDLARVLMHESVVFLDLT